jgi:hypothetical protein
VATERQIQANRRNAQHCTGPKSDKGKENSSKNSFKTGLDAKSEIIRYEKREDYDALTAEYHNRFRPATPEERALVDDLIKSEWHGRRYHAIDASVLDRAIQNVPSGNLGIAYTNCAATLSRVERKINSAQRNFQRALKQLMDIQAKRPQDLAPEFEDVDSAIPDAPSDPTASTTAGTPELNQNEYGPDIANNNLNQKSVSFLTFDESSSRPSTEMPLSTPITQDDPPIAA